MIILDFDTPTDLNGRDTGKPGSFTSLPDTTISPIPLNKGIVKRVFYTRTEFTIYPNGTIYPGKTETWFKDKAYVPKKPKYDKKCIIEVNKGDIEEY